MAVIDQSSSIQLLKKELSGYGISSDSFEQFLPLLNYEIHKKNTILFHQTQISKDVFMITEGIIAVQSVIDDKEIISRFFTAGDACMNVTNTISGELGIDNLISMTEISGFRIPFSKFIELYHSPTDLGRFIREKILEEIASSKDITSAKIMYKSNDLDLYLRSNHPEIIRDVPSKYIAMFMGISPEAYSRLLSKRHKNI